MAYPENFTEGTFFDPRSIPLPHRRYQFPFPYIRSLASCPSSHSSILSKYCELPEWPIETLWHLPVSFKNQLLGLLRYGRILEPTIPQWGGRSSPSSPDLRNFIQAMKHLKVLHWIPELGQWSPPLPASLRQDLDSARWIRLMDAIHPVKPLVLRIDDPYVYTFPFRMRAVTSLGITLLGQARGLVAFPWACPWAGWLAQPGEVAHLGASEWDVRSAQFQEFAILGILRNFVGTRLTPSSAIDTPRIFRNLFQQVRVLLLDLTPCSHDSNSPLTTSSGRTILQLFPALVILGLFVSSWNIGANQSGLPRESLGTRLSCPAVIEVFLTKDALHDGRTKPRLRSHDARFTPDQVYRWVWGANQGRDEHGIPTVHRVLTIGEQKHRVPNALPLHYQASSPSVTLVTLWERRDWSFMWPALHWAAVGQTRGNAAWDAIRCQSEVLQSWNRQRRPGYSIHSSLCHGVYTAMWALY